MSGPVVVNGNASRRLDSLVLAVCLIVAFALRLTVILNQPDQLTQDRDVYLATATGLIEGRGYSVPNSSVPTAFRPPVYPVCLAVGLSALPPALAVAGVNVLSGLLTVWLTASLGASLQLGSSRFIAAFVVAIDPLLLRYSAQPMTESICTLLAVFWLWSMIAAFPRLNVRARLCSKEMQSPHSEALSPQSRGEGTASTITHGHIGGWPDVRGLLIGLAFGLLVLSRPTFWLIAGFCVLGWLIDRCRNCREPSKSARNSDVRIAVCSLTGAIIVVGPWVVRNWLVFSVPILTTTHGGYTLLLGNNPVFYSEVVHQPWGTVWSNESLQAWDAEMKSKTERELGPHASDVQIDVWQSRQAWAFISADPKHFMEAAVHRVRSLWNTVPQGEQSGMANTTVLTAIGWYTAIVLAAGLFGAGMVLRRGVFHRWWPLFAMIATVQVVHLFYWTNTRMRAPLVPAIALFAAAVISESYRPRANSTGQAEPSGGP